MSDEPNPLPLEADPPPFDYGDDGMPVAFDPDGANPPEEDEVVLDDPLARLAEMGDDA